MAIIFGLNYGYTVLNLCIVVVHKSCMMERKEAEVHKYQPALRCLPETEAQNGSVISNVNDHGRLKLLIFRILVLCSGLRQKGGGGLSARADLELPVCHAFLVCWKHGYELRFVMLFKSSTES